MIRTPLAALSFLLALDGCGAPGYGARPHSSSARHDSPSRTWEYHFDRNALTASAPVGSSLIALTEAGHVLRFDLGTLRLSGEQLSGRRVLVLGAATANDALIGFAGGRIARLDSRTLTATPVAAVEGRPVWLGICPGISGPIVVYASEIIAPYPFFRSRGLESFRVRLLATNEEFEIEPGSTFLCDSKRRLWIGEDKGEWGGTAQVVDLTARPLAARSLHLENGDFGAVYGLAESPDGEVLAFGGMLHMGSARAFVTRLSATGSSKTLYAAEYDDRKPEETKRSPRLPITQVLPVRDGWIALSYGAAFKTDRAFSDWQHLTDIQVRTNPGRPDAVASYPGIVDARHIGDGILLTTRRDGLLEFHGGSVVAHTLSGQLDVAPSAVTAWPEGMAARDFDGRLSVHLNGSWGRPFENLPALRTTARSEPYAHGSYLPLPDGRAFVVATPEQDADSTGSVLADGIRYRPVSLVSALLEKGSVATASEQGADVTTRSVDSAFLLPSGTPAMIGPDDTLWAFANQKWARVEPPRHLRPIRKWVVQDKSRWLGLSHRDFFHEEQLAWIDLGSKSETEAVPVPVQIDGHNVHVDDAIVWDSQRLLLATDPRLCLVELATGNCAPFDRGIPIEAGHLARDTHNRIWAAGRGLWRLDGELGPVPYPAALPFLQDADVVDLETIGGRLVLALRERGIAVLDIDPAGHGFDQPILDPWNSRQPHEPRLEDGAVFVSLDLVAPSGPEHRLVEEFYDFSRRLRADVRSSAIRAYHAWEPDKSRPYRFVFYTSDVDSLARCVFRLAQGDSLAPRLRVMIRRGPRERAPIIPWTVDGPDRAPAVRP